MKWIGLSEGGLVDHPDDPGGRTNKGITQRVYTAWLRMQDRKVQAVDHITQDEAEAILFEQYFEPVKFDRLPPGLDYTVVDFAVNSGVRRASEYLQRAIVKHGIRISVDGAIGNETLAALDQLGRQGKIVALIEQINRDRWAFMKRLRHWPAFKTGWTRRVMGDKVGVQAGDHGVIDRSVRLAQGQNPLGPVSTNPGRATDDAPEGKSGSGVGKLLAALLGALTSLFNRRS